MERLSHKPWFYPIALLIIGLVTYAYALPSLGYYWDDWEVVFLLNTKNLPLLYGYFAFDRPFAWPYQLMYAAFGLNAAAWHVVTLLLRWAGILLLYFSLKTIWGRYDSYLRWWGALLLVYPGFSQQSISAAYERHFTAFALFGLSIYLMTLAVRHPGKAWLLWPLSWGAALIQSFTIEYFVGLELIRVWLLWMLVAIGPGSGFRSLRTLGRTLLRALPYWLLVGFYLWWRLAVFPGTTSSFNYAADFKFLQDFNGSFAAGVLAVLTRAFFDLIYSTTRVWLAALSDPAVFTFQSKIAWFAFGAGLLISAVFALVNPAQLESESQRSRSWRSLFFFGLGAFLLSALPIWLTSRQLSSGGRWDDRFSLAPMIGAGLITLCLIGGLIRVRWHRTILFVLLAISVTTQILVVNRYRLEWSIQNAYYWELAWRVPALKPETAIFSMEQPSASVPGYDTSFALNVLFEGNVVDGSVPYWFFTNDRFLNFSFVPGKAISYKDRNLRFSGNTSNAIAIVHQGENRCLQVLDAPYGAEPFYGQDQAQLVGVSNVSRILTNTQPSAPDTGVFGPEPPHTWCYYYEKADLARQMRDWELILGLEEQADANGLAPKFGPEYLPFIEANAQTGKWQKALELSGAARATVTQMEPLLCSTWTTLSMLPAADASVVEQAMREFACSAP